MARTKFESKSDETEVKTDETEEVSKSEPAKQEDVPKAKPLDFLSTKPQAVERSPAYALINVMGVTGDPPKRAMIAVGQVIPESQLEGLEEGIHFTRIQPKKKPELTMFGRKSFIAKTTIIGPKGDNPRHEYLPGDEVSKELVEGMTLGEQFE